MREKDLADMAKNAAALVIFCKVLYIKCLYVQGLAK